MKFASFIYGSVAAVIAGLMVALLWPGVLGWRLADRDGRGDHVAVGYLLTLLWLCGLAVVAARLDAMAGEGCR